MAKSKSSSNDQLLFGDLSRPNEHSEAIDVSPQDSLARIQSDVEHTHTCGVCKPGMPTVFGVGPAPSELMLIGEGPGIDDIEAREPFCGHAGVLLNRMLAAINQARASVYICNVIKCIPPGERNFSVAEVEDCRPILLRQILVVRPKVIVAFGALAALWVMGSPFGFMAFLGCVSLVGVIVSHIIVLFDFIEEAHERGESLHEALLDAGIMRLRPVLITVGATVIALFPLAAHGGPLWQPMCYAQIGGLTLATVITLLLVPVLYAIFVLDLKLVAWETNDANKQLPNNLDAAEA